MYYRFDYYKGNESLGSTYKELATYEEALECARLRLNDECDKVMVFFGDNYDGYFEVK